MDKKSRILVLSALILVAIATRWLPHPPNFAPMMAIALFAGMMFRNSKLAYIVPAICLIASDALIGFYDMVWAIYLCYAIVIFFGQSLQSTLAKSSKRWKPIAGGVLSASVIFFLTTNFVVWAFGSLYAKDLSGLWQSYVMALPFFKNSLMGDIFYSATLFGSYEAIRHYSPELVVEKE